MGYRALWSKLTRADKAGYLVTTTTTEEEQNGRLLLQGLDPNHAYTVLGVVEEKLPAPGPAPKKGWRITQLLWSKPDKARDGWMDEEKKAPPRCLRLIKVRNPHGKNRGTWQGDWGNDSTLWRQHPALKAKLGVAAFDPGTFLIPLQAYKKVFDTTGIVKVEYTICSPSTVCPQLSALN
jgi:hypothetical protein